jgi:hypothetical protein
MARSAGDGAESERGSYQGWMAGARLSGGSGGGRSERATEREKELGGGRGGRRREEAVEVGRRWGGSGTLTRVAARGAACGATSERGGEVSGRGGARQPERGWVVSGRGGTRQRRRGDVRARRRGRGSARRRAGGVACGGEAFLCA